MKSLLFILLAGYAARCEDNNYYVIEMPNDPPIQTKKPFKVYWNVPTMQCSSKGIHFERLYEKFGIIQNDNDRFKGEKLTILYDPGMFPALFKNETSGKFRFRNGGVPQEGNLEKHLDAFTEDLDDSIPDKDFSGVGIIDFESWRPIFRQNFGVLRPYKEVSFEIERKLHWWWHKTWIEAEAKRRFEEAAKLFMHTTLTLAKQLRPNALWGFYGFPYCFNMASNSMVETCSNQLPQENDQIHWLWSESTALYPSIYSSAKLSTSQLKSLIRGRIREAGRCAVPNSEILPYFWFRYRDSGYLSERDLNMALSTLYQSNATGIIVWGSSNDVNTVAKCNKLFNYIENIFGPAIANYTQKINKLHDDITTSTVSSNYNTESTTFSDTSNLNINIETTSESYTYLPTNLPQDVNTEEINNKNTQFNTNNNANDAVLLNNSMLIDLINNTVLNIDKTSTTIATSHSKKDKKEQFNETLHNSTNIYTIMSTDTSQLTSTTDEVTTNTIFSTDEFDSTTPQALVPIIDNNFSLENIENYSTTQSINENIIIESEASSTYYTAQTTTTGTYIYTTKNEYDEILDNNNGYFFNYGIFGNEFTTRPIERSKNDKKGQRKIATGHLIDTNKPMQENSLTENRIIEINQELNDLIYLTTNTPISTTNQDIETTESNTFITTNTDVSTFNPTEPSIKSDLIGNNKNRLIETDFNNNDIDSNNAFATQYEVDSSFLPTNSNDVETTTNNLSLIEESSSESELKQTIEAKLQNITEKSSFENVTFYEADESIATEMLEEASVVPVVTSTDQVVV